MERLKCEIGSSEKKKKVDFSMDVSVDLYEKLKGVAKRSEIDDIELRKELATMHQVLKTDGADIIKKIDNFNNCVLAENAIAEVESNPIVNTIRNNGYKLKYKY